MHLLSRYLARTQHMLYSKLFLASPPPGYLASDYYTITSQSFYCPFSAALDTEDVIGKGTFTQFCPTLNHRCGALQLKPS